MNRLRIVALIVVSLFAGFVSSAKAVTTYGSPAAAAALRFDPFSQSASTVQNASQEHPSVLTSAAGVSAPDITRSLRTIVNPGTPTLNVVDAPRVFEAPYLHPGLKASFIVTLNPTSKKTVTVKYRTVNGTGRAGIEYGSKTGTLTFQPGHFSQIVEIDVLNDDLKVSTNVPGPRTFFLEIFTPTNAKIGRDRGMAQIVENGKKQVGVEVGNALPVYETGKNIKSIFTISLNQPSNQIVKVDYKTMNGTAQAGSDYKAVSGTLTFQPGQMSKTVTVTVFDNSGPEAIVENFFLDISNPHNAILLNHQGTGEIAEFAKR